MLTVTDTMLRNFLVKPATGYSWHLLLRLKKFIATLAAGGLGLENGRSCG